MEREFILIYGPQGSGKSTQGRQLAKYLNYKFVSSGELLRRLKDRNSPVGLELSKYWVKGDLVPNEVIEGILFPVLKKEDVKGFVLDGYPRNIRQLESFQAFLEMNSWKLSRVFYLDVGKEECVRRLKLRASIERRPDETEEAVRKRLDIYYAQAKSLLDKYEQLEVLDRVDGERSVDDIQSDLRDRIAMYKR